VILLHLRLELCDGSLLRVGLLRRGICIGCELLVARQIDAGVGKVGRILRLLR
jgi:hypothetical protein